MAVDKLSVNDPRVQTLTASIRGKTYSYILAKPTTTPRATILLVHGFPDIGFGWRYQVPLLLSLGLQVIVPDMLGYGGTDAPQDLALYSLKSVSDDLAELARHVVPDHAERLLLGGHDWGGMVVWRLILWHPEIFRAVFSICTPYAPIYDTYLDLPALATALPSFRYQIQLASPEVEREIGSDPAKIRALLTGMYGARGPAGEDVFTVDHGVHFEHLDKMGKCPLLNDEEVDFYVKQYARNGMRGPLNWYRTRKINYDEELVLLKDGQQPRVTIPSLMVVAKRDEALLPSMSRNMDQFFDNLKKVEVDGTHWALWAPFAEQTNEQIRVFLEEQLGGPVKASI